MMDVTVIRVMVFISVFTAGCRSEVQAVKPVNSHVRDTSVYTEWHACSLTFALVNAYGVYGLKCWTCIAHDCAKDPSDNYKAIQKPCSPGQACQKVYFEMYSDLDKRSYSSTVRGCSSTCKRQDDFLNCTKQQMTSRGCIRKECCDDNDLCNGSCFSHLSTVHSVTLVSCLVYIHTLWRIV